MKKILVSVLTVCFVLSALSALSFASESDVIDLSGYDDEQIVALYEQVKEELVARHIEKTAHLKASQSEYIIGRDIPAGDYIIQKSEENGEGYVSLKTDGVDLPKLIEIIDSDEDFFAYITAEEGDSLYIDFDCDLTISTGVKFE